MDRAEVLRRFRLVMVSYVVIAITFVVGLAVDWQQTQDIRTTENRLKSSTALVLIRNCEVVHHTASVFVDFIEKEIDLRQARALRPVPLFTRVFDEGEIHYWVNHTLPMLKMVLKIQCPKTGG
jgi:hypothetical protein